MSDLDKVIAEANSALKWFFIAIGTLLSGVVIWGILVW